MMLQQLLDRSRHFHRSVYLNIGLRKFIRIAETIPRTDSPAPMRMR